MAKKNSGLRFQPAGGERAAQVPVGKKQRLHITRLANDGRGVGFVDKRTWFVSGALAGEEVEARVCSARSQVVEARTERVLQAAAERRAATCVHAAQCGGCSLQHMPHAQQQSLKHEMLASHLSRAGVEPQEWAKVLGDREYGYRRRARIAVRWEPKARHLAVGFRAQASQAIVDISQCPVLVEPLQPILAALPEMLRSLDKPQHLGHVELFHGRQSLLLVRQTGVLSALDLERLQTFCQQHQAQLWLQGEGQPQPLVSDANPGYDLSPWSVSLNWQPGDFVQVNAPVNQSMVAQALDWLAPQAHERVLDLFCGLGNFALPLARLAREVVAVEGVQGMVQRGAANAEANGLTNVHFVRADLSEPLAESEWAAGGFDALLLDPPRDGALQVTQQIAGFGAKRILYVSCNPATLARDAGVLQQQGYRLMRAGILDMFPQTAHVEAMALFVRD